MIPRRTVEQILDAARIEEVVGDFVTLKRRGVNMIACCPFHNEKTPSFYVSPAKGIFKCFGCGKSGTAVGFVMEHENLSYGEALKYLAKKYHIEVVEKEETAEDIAARQRSESLMLVSDFAHKFFMDALKTPEGQIGYAYFKSRGLEDETIAKFGLGWAPNSRNALQSAAKAAGFKEEYLVDTGLCFRTERGQVMDRFYDRVVFPIHNVSGSKYVNSPETDIYQKRTTLYGMYQARNEVHKQDKFILVEGYLDVISMHQLGICNVAASSGTSLTTEQVKLIKRYTDNTTIIYDGDSAGIHAALRGIGLLLEGGLNVKVVLLPDGDDPDSFSRKHTLQEVQDFIKENEQDFIGFKTRFLLDDAGRDPIKKAGLINDIADTIALIPDPVKRSVYVPYAAGELGIAEQLLFDRIKKTRAKMLEEKRREQQREQERGAELGAPAYEAPMPSADDMPYDGPGDGSMDMPADYGNDGPSYSAVPLVQDPMVNDKALFPCEKELLTFVLRNGRTELRFDADSPYYRQDKVWTVAEFIDAALYQEEAEFSNGSLLRTYEKYFALYEQNLEQTQIIVRMLSDEDELVRRVTDELVSDRHVLTVGRFEASQTITDTALVHFVPRSLLAYDKARVDKQLQELTRSLSQTADEAQQEEIMKKILELNIKKNKVTTALGRV